MNNSELNKLKIQADTEALNKVLIHQFFEAIDNGNFDRVKQLVADDFTLQSPSLPKAMDKDMLLQAIKTHYTSFPDWTHTIEDTIAEGNKVVVNLIQCGTHIAEYEGIPATGNKIVQPAMHLAKIVDGKFKEWWMIEDNLDFMQQLNMELKPNKDKIQI
jgi:steroid delta-isomerase-like uncharacterized protein